MMVLCSIHLENAIRPGVTGGHGRAARVKLISTHDLCQPQSSQFVVGTRGASPSSGILVAPGPWTQPPVQRCPKGKLCLPMLLGRLLVLAVLGAQ